MNIVKVKFYNKLVGAYSQEYLCEDGAVINDELNETLDSASIVIKNQTSVLDIQPFDKVQLNIYDDSELIFSHYFLVNSWQRAITRQVNAKTYNYSISLISETKELEGIPLPNLVITNDSGLSVLDYIKRYNSLYGHYNIIDANFIGFDDVVCPNMRWNTPTLREVLNDLCLVKDCLIVLVNGNLKAVNISIKGSEFTSEYITYENVSQSLEDYTSETRTTLANVIDLQDSKSINEVTFRNSEVAYFNTAGTDNAGEIKLELKKPIYEIKSLKLCIPISLTPSGETYYYQTATIDLTEYVKEKSVFATLLKGRGSTYLNDLSSDLAKNCVYYVRGGNTIEGFTSNGADYFIGKRNITTIEIWKKILLNREGYSLASEQAERLQVGKLSEWRFEIDYIALNEMAVQLSRGTNYQRIRNNRVIFDNQDNSGVNIQKFIDFNKNKLNRLSNEVGLIQQQNIPSLDDIAQLRQTYKGSVIYSRSMRVGRKCFNCEYYATKDYVLANYFTQINSQKRNFIWIDEGQAVKRQEFKKIYYEFNFASGGIDYKYLDYDTIMQNQVEVENYLRKQFIFASSPLFEYSTSLNYYRDDARNIKFAVKSGNTQFTYDYHFGIEGTLQCINNLVAYNFQLDSNVFVGYKREWHESDVGNDYPVAGWYNEGTKYITDVANAKFDSLYVKLGGHNYIDELQISSYYSNDYTNLKNATNNLPKLATPQSHEGLSLTYSFDMYKDNAEKLGLSMNFEWVSTSEDIEILNNIASKSLFNNSRNIASEYLMGESLFSDLSATTLLTEGYGIDNETSLGLYSKVNVYGTPEYYSNKEGTHLINQISTRAGGIVSMFIYEIETDKLYVETLVNNYPNQITAETSREVKVDDIVYYRGQLKRIVSITNEKVILGNYSAVPVLNNRYQELKDCKCYDANGNLLATLSYQNANLDNDTGTINIIPPANCDYIIINEALKIKNVSNHISNNKIVVYLKIKDYFI